MDQGFRRGFTTAEKTELWDRWQRGESLKAIGRAFGKPSSSIYFQVSPHGGIRPSPRRRSRLALTLSDSAEIGQRRGKYGSEFWLVSVRSRPIVADQAMLIMAAKSKDTWYVSFAPKKPIPGRRSFARATETFANESEAKRFAKAKLADTLKVSAGTLNPHVPKRTIASNQIMEWLEEPLTPHRPG